MKKQISFRSVLIIIFSLFIFRVYAQPSNVWTQKASFAGGSRANPIAFSIGSKGYVGLGGSNSDFWEYDPATNVWTQKANYPGAISEGYGFGIGTKGYVSDQYDFWMYDPSTNTWTQKTSCPNWGIVSGLVIGTKGYVWNGYSQFYEYETTTDTWTQKANFPGATRGGPIGFTIGNQLYVGMGVASSNCCIYNDMWKWDQATNTWTQKGNFPGPPRYYGSGFSIYNKGYAVCGITGSGGCTSNDFWEYEPTTDIWTQKANFGGATRQSGAGLAIGTKGYYGIGNNANCGGQTYTDFWEYTPTCLITPTLVSQTNVSCNAGSNGTATVTATGGTGPLSYSWSLSGGTTTVGTNLPAGTFTCTVSDANACLATKTVTITQPSAITSSVLSQTATSCFGGSNGAATISASGGTGAYTYSWSPSGGTTTTGNALSAINYTCTITDANACIKTQTVTITQPTIITSSVSAQSNVTGCFGNSNGAVTISANGGTGAYTYSWSPSGGTAAIANNLVAGSYTCTITDANACVKTQTVSISQPALLTSTVSSQSNVSGCFGNNNGTATVSGNGGTGTYTYSWFPTGGTSTTAINLIAGNYSCTITDVNGCAKTQTLTITQPPAITSSISSQTNVSCNGGNNGSITILASGGTGSLVYSWSPSGGTSATESNLAAGSYTCTIKDANNCTKIQTAVITQPSAISSSVSAQTNVSCNGGNDGSASVFASGGTGALTYLWAPTGATTASVSNLSAGAYVCTITDANNCTKNQTVSITQPNVINTSVLGQSNVSGCFGQSNGSATILAGGGTGTLNYLWVPSGGSSASATNLSANTYTCYVTDANSCTKTQVVTISQPPAINSSVSFQSDVTGCYGQSTGAAGVSASGGTGALTYSWSPVGGTSSTAINLGAGSYTCTITDANSCTKTQTVTITQPALITSSISSQDNVTGCFGQTNGDATVLASGGTGTLTYNWTPSGGTSATASNLGAGSYTCTIMDVNSCAKTQTVTITQPQLITSSVSSQNNVSGCYGQSNGAASVSASGGTGILTYNWLPSGGTAATGSNLTAGTYTCTITDANNCTATQTVIINQPPAITSTITAQTNLSCHGGNNGSVSVAASGGTGSLNYVWAPSGSTLTSISNLVAGIYTCTITDLNNCIKNQLVTITQPSAIVPTITSQGNVSCSGGSNGFVILSASGGTGVLNYNWLPSGGTSDSAINLAVGSYTCTITDANNCSKTQTVNITLVVPETPTICMLTADSLSLNNIIYWDKTMYLNVDSFILYRYDAITTNYLRIGAVSKDSSQFTDTQRNIGGPNGGDPQYGSWQYKLALRDTCGNISAKSPYHKSVFVQESAQNFSWSPYTIEAGQSNPITGYSFSRDDNNTGNWNVLVNTVGLSTTDPNYTSYPNGNWRVDALGFSCTPTFRLANGTLSTIVRSKSNITNNRTTGIKQSTVNAKQIIVYPNPSNGIINIQSENDLGIITITNSLGEIVYSEKINVNQYQIDLSKQSAGIYVVETQGNHIRLIKD